MIEVDDDYQNYNKNLEILMKLLQKSEEDIEAGRTIDYLDFIDKLRNKYNI